MSALRGPTGLTNSSAAPLASMSDAAGGVHPMPSTDHEKIFFHFDLLRSLQMHKKLAASLFLLALLAAAALLVKGWNSYTAQALVYVQPAPPRLLDSAPENRWPYDANTYESYIEQQIHNVTRPDVLIGAVKKVPGWQQSGENMQLAAARLGRALQVTRVGSGYQISITAKAKSADKAAQVANAAAASFIESATREMRAGDDQRIQLLRDERDRVQKELAADRAEQDALNKKLGVAAMSSLPVDPIDQQIDAVRGELIKARADSDQAAARLMATKGGTSSGALDAEADDLVASDPGLVSMKTSLNARRSQLISQMANLTPNNPQYKQDSEELAHINASLESMTKELRAKAAAHIQQKLKNDLDRTATVESKLNSQLAQLTAAAGSAGPRLQRLNELSVDIQRLQSRFAMVDGQYQNLMLEYHAPGSVFLSAAAVAPLGASRDLVLRNAIVIVLAGLLLGWGAALVAHNLDQRVYIAKDVERVLGVSPMAQIPDFSEVGPGVEEEYLLRLAAALEHAYQQGELKSCIFTGVTSGTGATTISTRVTNMLEAMGRATVLVDASGTPAAAAPPSETVVENEASGLVPAPRGSRSTALLQQMAEEKSADTIVLSDTAPLLVSGETEYLARFVDSAIVVIQSGVTTKAQLRDVAHTLQRLDVSAVGFVLNRIGRETANPSFRDAVRAVEQRIYGESGRPEQKSAKAKAPREKKKKPADSEKPESAKRKKKREAAAAAAAAAAEAEAKRAQAPEPIVQPPPPPAAEPERFVPPPSTIASEPAPARFQDVRVEAAQPAVRQEIEQQEEERGQATPLRGRPLRQKSPAPVPPAVSQPAPPPPAAAPNPVASPAPVAPPAPVAAPAPVAPPIPAAAMPYQPEPAPPAPVASRTPAPPAPLVERAQPVMPPAPPVVKNEPPAVKLDTPVPPFAGANSGVLHEIALQGGASAPEGQLRELPYSAARLGGLRNLLVSLGLRSLNKEGESIEEQAPAEAARPRAAAERPTERPVYAEPLAPVARVSDPQQPAAEPVEVVAKPEFLPPNPLVEVTEKEPEPESRPAAPPAPRKNLRDSDDIDILPSWRGQYRKRR